MNKKMVLLILISSSLLLWMLSSLFIAFVKAVPEGVGVEEDYLTKQDFADVASSGNRQYSSLRGDTERICGTEATASPAGIELYYDDGTAERGYYWVGPGGMFAVRFTPPASGRLIECSFYIYNRSATFNVHILDTNKNDMISPFPETPQSTGWFHVDLSTCGITVSPDVDFYIAMETTVANDPSLGADTSNPDGRSWDYDGVSWSQWLDNDYMIRAVIAGVDLKITNVYLEPSDPMPGDNVTFYADVENQGTENATDFRVELYLDEEPYASATFSLDAGVNDTYWNTNPWTATLGNHTVRWVIDATDVIDELNEDNNEMSKTFGVGYALTVQTPYSPITVKIDGSSYLTDPDGNFQTYVDQGSHSVEVQTPVSLGSSSRGVFVQWSDGNPSNPRTIFVNNDLTLTAEYVTQYCLTVGSPYGTAGGGGWYDNYTTAYATLNTGIVDHLNGTRRVFTYWGGDASGTNYAKSNSILMDGPKTVTANWKTEYLVTFAQTELDTTANGTVVTVNGDAKTFSHLPYTTWVDGGNSISYSYSDPVLSSVKGKRFKLVDVTGPVSPITVTGPVTVTGNYKIQYQVTVKQSGCGTTVTATIDGDSHDLPVDFWFDEGSEHTISVPSTVNQYEFTRWHDDKTTLSRTIVVTSPAEYTAYYARPLFSSSIPPLSLSSPTISLGKTITLSGSIVPAREGVLVTLTYTRPDGSTLNRTVTSSSDGRFSDTYTPDAAGTWSVTASWPGDADHYGATSTAVPFRVTTGAWWETFLRPEILQVIVGVVGIVLTVAIVGTAWANTRKKRSRVRDLLSEIDNIYLRFKINARRCEAELYRLKDIVLEEYKSGKIIEESYNILNVRIDDYIEEIREEIINEKLGGFPSKLRDELHRMIEDREITAEGFSALDKLLKRTAGLTESEREELRNLLEKWKKDYLKD